VRIRWLLALVLAAAVVATPARPAEASLAELTLAASSSEVSFGESVVLSGTLASSDDASPLPGQLVRILDPSGGQVGSDVTAEDGGFSVTTHPEANVVLHAEWLDPDHPDHVVTSPTSRSWSTSWSG
jgi:hypothetical protein